MSITILKHNVPWGPFTRPQIDDALQRGDFTLAYLAHAPGLKEWLPLGEVLDYVDRGHTLPPLPTARELPQVPARPPVPADPIVTPAPLPLGRVIVKPPALPQPVNLSVPTSAVSPVPAPPTPAPRKLLRTAPFILRGLAFFIDVVILFAPIVVIFMVGGILLYVHGAWDQTDHESMNQSWALFKRNFLQIATSIAIVWTWLYAAVLESSRWQGTIGKQWLGLRVSDWNGERISFLRASCRHFAKFLSGATFGIGFAMALFSSQGLTLHDHLVGTRVIR